MLVSASSTARVMDLRCAAGNPSVSASGSTAPRTVESNRGLLHSAIISRSPPRCPSRSVIGRGEVFMRDMGGFLCKVVGGAGNGGHFPGFLAARLEAANRAVKYNEVRGARGPAVTIAIDVLEAALLFELANQVFIECDLKLGGQFNLVGLNHLDLNRGGLDLRQTFFIGRKRGCVVPFGRRRVRALCDELFLDRFGGACRHGENGAVQPAVAIAIPKCERVDLAAEQSQETSGFIRGGDADGTDRVSDGGLRVRSDHDVLDGGRTYAGSFLGMEKMQLPIFHLQASLGIVLDAGEPRQQDRLDGLWTLLGT